MYFHYLRTHLNYYDSSDNKKLLDKLTNEYKQYKLDFLRIGKNNDINDFIKYKIESADNYLSKLSIKKLKIINKNKYINDFQRENDIKIMNNGLYSEFEEYKKVLKRWESSCLDK